MNQRTKESLRNIDYFWELEDPERFFLGLLMDKTKNPSDTRNVSEPAE